MSLESSCSVYNTLDPSCKHSPMIVLCVFLATLAMLGVLIVAAVALTVLALVAFSTSRLMQHCMQKAANTIYNHPTHSREAVIWVVRLVLDHFARQFRSEPNYNERIIQVDVTKLPSLVSNNKTVRLQTYINSLIDTERYLASTAIENARRFDVRMVPDLFLENGLVNGPRTIPTGTIIAVYYSTLCQKSTRDKNSSYIFTYGKFPAFISDLTFVLDAKPRLHSNPNSNAAFANHNCKDPNAEFSWVGINLLLRAAVPIAPFQNITAHYGPDYLFTESEAAEMRRKNTPMIACMCQAPHPCSSNMFLIAH